MLRTLGLVALLAVPAQAKPSVDRLLSDLETAQGDARLRVIRALGRSGKAKAAEALLSRFDVRKDGPSLSAVIAEALGRLRAKSAREPLAQAWAYLEGLRGAGELPPELLGLRLALLAALGEVGGDAASEILLRTLGDKDPAAARAAVLGLGRLKDRKAVPALLKLAADSRSADLTQAIYEALGALGDKSALPVLERAVGQEDSPLRAPAAYAIALIRGRPGVDLLEGILDLSLTDDKGGLLAAYYLVKFGRPSGMDHLISILENDGNTLQPWAAEALGKAGNPKAVRFIAEATPSEDPNVRVLVIRSLAVLGGSEAVSVLKAAGKSDPDAAVRAAAEQALAELGEAR